MRSRALIALAALVLVAGCGGSDDPDETTNGGETTTSQDGPPDDGPPPDAEALGPPKAKESIKEAQKRIAKAVASDDCDEVNELNPISREPLDNPTRCEYLKRLDGLEVLGAEEFGDAAGVIDYRFGDRVLSALLVVDTDGLYHVALFDPFNPKESVGTKLAPEFEQTADDAVEALADGDCEAYLEVAHRRFGRGARSDKEVCEVIEPNPVQVIRNVDPTAKPEELGGNGTYAFYSFGSPGVNFTMVLGRQTDEAIPEGVDPLPKDHAEYAYIDAYQTNRRNEE
jgi:hypothetical protein